MLLGKSGGVRNTNNIGSGLYVSKLFGGSDDCGSRLIAKTNTIWLAQISITFNLFPHLNSSHFARSRVAFFMPCCNISVFARTNAIIIDFTCPFCISRVWSGVTYFRLYIGRCSTVSQAWSENDPYAARPTDYRILPNECAPSLTFDFCRL